MTLRNQLLGAFAYVLLLIIVALEVPLALNLARRIDAEVKNEAASQAFIVAANASGHMGDGPELAKLARSSGRTLGARVIVVDVRGRLLADSTVAAPPNASYASRPEIATALGAKRAQGERHSDTLGQDLLYTAVPITNNGKVVGATRVTQSLSAVHSRIRRGVLALIAIGAFALIVGLALAWFLASSLSQPLRNLAATARVTSRRGRSSPARPSRRRSRRPSTTWRNGSAWCWPLSASSSRTHRTSYAPRSRACGCESSRREGSPARRRRRSSRPPIRRSSGSPVS